MKLWVFRREFLILKLMYVLLVVYVRTFWFIILWGLKLFVLGDSRNRKEKKDVLLCFWLGLDIWKCLFYMICSFLVILFFIYKFVMII